MALATRSPERVAREGVDAYNKVADFKSKRKATHEIARLEISPSTKRVGIVGRGVKRKAKRKGIRAVKRGFRELERGRLVAKEGSHDFSLSVKADGKLSLSQKVRPYNLDDFETVLHSTILKTQINYNNAYRKAAGNLTNKQHRKPKIARLLTAFLGMVTRIIPQAKIALAAISGATNLPRQVLEIFNQVLDGAILFLEEALKECDALVITGAIKACNTLKEWVTTAQDAYSRTVERAAQYVEIVDKIANNVVDYIAEILSGTLLGRIIAALADPVSWALEQINSFIDTTLSEVIEGALAVGGAAFGYAVCNWRELLFGQAEKEGGLPQGLGIPIPQDEPEGFGRVVGESFRDNLRGRLETLTG